MPLQFYKACWITGDRKKIEDFARFKQSNIMTDKDGNLVYLAQSEWFLNTERQNNPDIEFHFTSEFKTAVAQSLLYGCYFFFCFAKRKSNQKEKATLGPGRPGLRVSKGALRYWEKPDWTACADFRPPFLSILADYFDRI
jgi:hypothetical protein